MSELEDLQMFEFMPEGYEWGTILMFNSVKPSLTGTWTKAARSL